MISAPISDFIRVRFTSADPVMSAPAPVYVRLNREVVWSSEDTQRASIPTTDRESRCTVHEGSTRFASLRRLPTTAMFNIPRS
eukprot:9225101-Pyramimonas_sp.AAC.2